jgi:hypothetical protein
MDECLEGLSNTVRVVDDNVVYSADIKQHVKHVRDFLHRCRTVGIKLSEKKFKFAEPEVRFAGVILNADGYRMQPNVYKAIEHFEMPGDLQAMRRFVGMANQLAPFNEKLAKALQPLRPFMKRNAIFQPNGVWKPIMAGSRTLIDAECRYAPIELELAALKLAITKCHKFVQGTRFVVMTNHRPLVSIIEND